MSPRKSDAARIAEIVSAETERIVSRPARTDPVRITLDLDPELHRWLRHQALDARLPAAKLLRGLLLVAQHDPTTLARAVDRAQ